MRLPVRGSLFVMGLTCWFGRTHLDVGIACGGRRSEARFERANIGSHRREEALWIHTHPWDAYWSSTDLSTLASYSRILDRALVLGHDHMKSTRKAEGDCDRLGAGEPLSVWTSEEVRSYEEEGV